MNREENVIKYYLLCNKLKTVIRTGWTAWNVQAPRLESVAEHIYGVQMLAIAMHSEFKYDIDLTKVILMLAIHEIEEILIGDLTQFQITKENKEEIGHKAVEKVLCNLLNKDELNNLILEFDKEETKEAKFAHFCDKLECDLQSKVYDSNNYVDLNNQKDNKIMNNKLVKRLLDEGNSWSDMWLKFSQEMYNYDDNFKAVSDYALKYNFKK